MRRSIEGERATGPRRRPRAAERLGPFWIKCAAFAALLGNPIRPARALDADAPLPTVSQIGGSAALILGGTLGGALTLSVACSGCGRPLEYVATGVGAAAGALATGLSALRFRPSLATAVAAFGGAALFGTATWPLRGQTVAPWLALDAGFALGWVLSERFGLSLGEATWLLLGTAVGFGVGLLPGVLVWFAGWALAGTGVLVAFELAGLGAASWLVARDRRAPLPAATPEPAEQAALAPQLVLMPDPHSRLLTVGLAWAWN